MSIGTLFTLFVVPSLYVLIAADHQHASDAASDSAGLASAPSEATA